MERRIQTTRVKFLFIFLDGSYNDVLQDEPKFHALPTKILRGDNDCESAKRCEKDVLLGCPVIKTETMEKDAEHPRIRIAGLDSLLGG